ncbi:MAG: TatD family hydrolase [Clostridiales bacterium]|jgi:TatD DNase family protein|nr:TatD family hydrolase [Clostridiales bacterium]
MIKIFFDTHAHYDSKEFNDDREIKLNQLKDYIILNSGTNIESSKSSVYLANKYDSVFASIGIHPNYVENLDIKKTISELKNLAKNKKVLAIGEIGLDFCFNNKNKIDNKIIKKQILFFEAQLNLAKKLDLPVVIHSRNSRKETLRIIKKNKNNFGSIHCFNYDNEFADQIIKLGYYLGIGGIITFKNSKELCDTIRNIDIKNVVLETDTPYISPTPFRGKRNDSSNLKYVCEKISQVKNISYHHVKNMAFDNALNLFFKNKRYDLKTS